MLIATLLVIVSWSINIFWAVVSPFISAITLGLPTFAVTSIGYVLANVYLLNSFLPVSEFFGLAQIFLTIRLAMLAYKGFLYFTHMANHLRETFLRVKF